MYYSDKDFTSKMPAVLGSLALKIIKILEIVPVELSFRLQMKLVQ